MQFLEIGKKSGKIGGQEDAGELRRQRQDEEGNGAERASIVEEAGGSE